MAAVVVVYVSKCAKFILYKLSVEKNGEQCKGHRHNIVGANERHQRSEGSDGAGCAGGQIHRRFRDLSGEERQLRYAKGMAAFVIVISGLTT